VFAVILVAVLAGLVLGVLCCYLTLRRLVPSWASRLLEAWKRQEEAQIRAESGRAE
jgi:hypothetical protein